MTDIEKVLYTAEGDKYDHRADPWDCTNLCEAEPELAKQLDQQGYAKRWAIDGRWRWTAAGMAERKRRMELIRQARAEDVIQPFDNEALAPKEHEDD